MWILIVDDDEIVREGIKTILRDDPDFEVVAESGSAEGIVQLAQRTQPDVVLLDAPRSPAAAPCSGPGRGGRGSSQPEPAGDDILGHVSEQAVAAERERPQA